MQSSERNKQIQRAEQLVTRGKVRKALALYLQVLKTEADKPKLLNRAGDLCVRLQREREATTFYKRAVGVLHRQGFNPHAIALCRKILRLDPRLIDVTEVLAELLAIQGLIAEAVDQFEALVTYFRNHGHHGKAIRILERIVGLQPNSLSHRLELAALLEQQGRALEAQHQYRSIAATRIARGQPAAARQALVRAFELGPDDLDLVVDGIERLRLAGFPEEAENLLAVALKVATRSETLLGG